MQVRWLALTGRVLLVWVLVAVFFYYCGATLLQLVLPWLQWIANVLSVNYHAELGLGSGDKGTVINIVAQVTEDIYQYNIPIAPKGAELTGAGTLVHALTPLVILFTLIIAWPGSLRAVLARMLVGVPIGLAVLSCSLPFLLVSHIDEIFYTALQNVAKKPMPQPAIISWVMFMEMGGIWLLPLIGALGCVASAHHFKWTHQANFISRSNNK